MDLSRGGRAAIDRMIEAYGFTTKQALCDQLGISSSTLANRYLRDTFPADFVIQCALETGASLMWLTFGTGPVFDNGQSDIIKVPRKKILGGKLFDASYLMFDKAFIPENTKKITVIAIDKTSYFVESDFSDVEDGLWVIEVEGKVSIREIIRIPVGKVRVTGDIPFDCLLDDIKFISKVVAMFSCIS